ncbi:MAG TPA: hypothetical protein VMK42_01145 [Anaeromyxobacteraceae bacterium]|nr:hypothetical protein [Anaeromyxobacteraceae bacterium]
MTPRLRSALLALVPLAAGACSKEVVCSADQTVYQGQCLSLSSDPRNCGSPGLACAEGQSCSGGSCCSGTQCSPAIYVACFDGDQVRGATASLELVGAPVQVDSGPIAFARVGTALWVANSESNTLDELGLGLAAPVSSVVIPQSGSFSDLEYLGAVGGLLYASNDAVGSIVVVDPAQGMPVGEIQLGATSYPQGIAFAGTTTAYVALNGSDAVAVLDLTQQAVTKTIDLSALASPGARAMPARLLLRGTRLYVTLWNLVPATFAPGGNGLLAVVDTTTQSLALPTALDLGPGCQDPAGIALRGSTLYVTCGFFEYDSTTVTGGGIVPVDVSGTTPAVMAPVPTPGAAPGAITFCGDLAFVGDRVSGNVLRFDPAAGAIAAKGELCVPSTGSSEYVADVTCGE